MWHSDRHSWALHAKVAAHSFCWLDEWDKLQEQEKAWYEAFVVLPYENVLDFDAEGDDVFSEGIHIFTAPWVAAS